MSLDKFNTTPSPLQVVEKVNDVIDALGVEPSGGASVMQGATATKDGKEGLVPAPSVGDENKFLSGDGTFKEISVPVTSVNGQTGDVDIEIPQVFNSSGHLVLPDGSEFWIA